MADTSKALLNKLTIAPDQSGYSHNFGNDTLSAKYGVSGNYRRGFFNNAMPFDVSWIAKPCEYNYLMACYRAFINSGGTPFLIDLVADKYRLTEHKAVFEVGSVRLTKVQANSTYYVSARLWAEPAVQYDVGTRPFVVDQSLSDLRLLASSGAYHAILQNVVLRFGTRITTLAAGAYTVTGGSVTGRGALSAGSGAFVLTGKPVALKTNHRMQVQTGAYTVTGKTADLIAPP